MKVTYYKFRDAFHHAERHMAKQCPAYAKICSHDNSRSMPKQVYVKIVSAFWEEYLGHRITCNDTEAWIHFRDRADLSAFLLRWS